MDNEFPEFKPREPQRTREIDIVYDITDRLTDRFKIPALDVMTDAAVGVRAMLIYDPDMTLPQVQARTTERLALLYRQQGLPTRSIHLPRR